MSIEIVKLINGETLLTEVTFEDETHLHIIDPVQITVHTRKDASPICICTIWVPLTKEVNLFHIKQSAIMLKSEVDEDMITYYNRCLETINDSMEPEKSNNPFAYFTQIIYYAFLRRIQKEKKNLYVKIKFSEHTNVLGDTADTQGHDSGNDYNDNVKYGEWTEDYMARFVEDFEENKRRKIKKKKETEEGKLQQ